MESTQCRYRIKRGKINIFLDWAYVSFNPRMNSSFIILLLKKDLELQNEDIMMREVSTLTLLATKHQSNVSFLLLFSCSFFSGTSKATPKKSSWFWYVFFVMGYIITWRPCSTVCWLPASQLWYRHLVPSEWRVILTAHETLISIKLGYFSVSIELFSQHTMSESKQFVNQFKKLITQGR